MENCSEMMVHSWAEQYLKDCKPFYYTNLETILKLDNN